MKIYNMPAGALGTNTYLVVDELSNKGFIGDPGAWNQDMKNRILETGVELEYIMLTHGHADHIMGVPGMLKDFPNLKVIANKEEKDMLADPDFNMSWQFGQVTVIEPDILVEDGEKMKVGTLEITFLHTPGHSPGGMCIYVPEWTCCFSGDTLFQNSIGRTDFPGCSYKKLADSVHEKLWPMPDNTDIYPGHMGPTYIGWEKEHNPFV